MTSLSVACLNERHRLEYMHSDNGKYKFESYWTIRTFSIIDMDSGDYT